MRKSMSILIALVMILSTFNIAIPSVYAQGENKTVIKIEDDKTEVKVGEEFYAYINVEQAIDVFGLQFTVNYDPELLKVVGGGINIEPNMTVFGGIMEDFEKGVLTYPVINTEAKKEKIDSMPVANIIFRALKQGPVIITLTNIKAVNSDIREIHYNTQYQAVLNIKGTEKPESERPEATQSPGPGAEGTEAGEDSPGPEDPGNQDGNRQGDSSKDSDKGQKTDPTQSHTPGEGQEDTGQAAEGAEEDREKESSGESGSDDIKPGQANWAAVIIIVLLLGAAAALYAFRDRIGIQRIIEKITGRFK